MVVRVSLILVGVRYLPRRESRKTRRPLAASTAMMRAQLPTVDVVLSGGKGERRNVKGTPLEDLNRRNVIHFNEKVRDE